MTEITREEFITRFKIALRVELGPAYDEKYATEIAPTYYDEQFQDGEGPEECAEAEASEWGQE